MWERIRRRKVLFFTCIFAGILIALPKFEAKASEEKVKIGYFPMTGYQESMQDGNRWGYSYDYLQEIATYTDWEYEYVEGSWDECLERLEKGEIDLVTSAKWTPEREEKFDFSEYRLGVQYSVITVRRDEDRYSYNDYAGFDGMLVGMMKSNRCNEEIEEIAKQYQIALKYIIFDTEAELKEALEFKKIDAIVSSNQRIIENEKVIAKFELAPFFAIFKDGDKEIAQQMNDAMFEIMTDDPYFEAKLYKKYFENNPGYKIALSKEEKEYVAENPVIQIVASPNATPKCYYDNSKYTGIVIDCVEKMAEEVGLQIEYIPTVDYSESIEYLKQGKADALGDFYADYSWAERNGLIYTQPYLDVNYFAVSRKIGLTNVENVKVATCKNFFFNNMYVFKHHDRDRISFYETEEECMNAVKRGVADIAYVNQYTAKVLLERDENLTLTGNTVFGSEYGLAVAVKKQDKMLAGIMEKAIANLEDDIISKIIEEHTVKQTYNVSLSSYIYYNFLEFTIILAVLLTVIILVLLYVMNQKRKYSKHIEKLAYQDRLTGIPNIYLFEELGKKKRSEQKVKNYFILSLDISHFAIINESYGRAIGDNVICFVATKLQALAGEKGIVARNKVDNFLLMKSFVHRYEIEEFVSLVREEISVCTQAKHEIKLNFNCGVVEIINNSNISIKKAIDRAELARKIAKAERFQTQYFNKEMEKQLHREKIIEDSFKNALEKDEFLVYYQPKVHMQDGKIVGAEALVRWISEDNGFMSPDEFIPILEGNGAIVELDFYVLEKVFELLNNRIQL